MTNEQKTELKTVLLGVAFAISLFLGSLYVVPPRSVTTVHHADDIKFKKAMEEARKLAEETTVNKVPFSGDPH